MTLRTVHVRDRASMGQLGSQRAPAVGRRPATRSSRPTCLRFFDMTMGICAHRGAPPPSRRCRKFVYEDADRSWRSAPPRSPRTSPARSEPERWCSSAADRQCRISTRPFIQHWDIGRACPTTGRQIAGSIPKWLITGTAKADVQRLGPRLNRRRHHRTRSLSRT